jgi:transposase
MVVSMYLNGDNFHEASIVRLRANYEFPSMRTVYRWLKQYNNDGTVLPNCPTGNRHSTREVNGGDLINLAIFRLVRPKAYIDEVRAYVHNRNPQNPPYSSSQIVRAEQRLGLSRKAASTTSDRAYLPINMHRRHLYRNAAYPDGVFGESTQNIIDLDESKFKIEDQNRKFGKVVREKRCDATGKYVHGSNGVDLLMAISVEYVFNTIQTMLQMDPEGVDDIHGLVNKINGIIGDMTNFKPYFIHVLFPNN